MSRLISRDPFARTELHSEQVTHFMSTRSCKWCGGIKYKKSGKRYLYEYANYTDGGAKNYIPGYFCSVSCMRNYHR